MSDDVMRKLVVTAIALISMMVWLNFDRNAGCTKNRPTDISAQRRQAVTRACRNSPSATCAGRRCPADLSLLVVPGALSAAAFEHVNDAAGAGVHQCSDQLQFFTAAWASLAGVVFQVGNLLSMK
jgi:hypothetical protein